MTSTWLWGIAGTFGTLLAIGVELALLIVALTVVQRRRPDAALLLLAGAALDLTSTVVSYPIPIVLLRVLPVAEYAQWQAVATVIFSIFHATAKVLIICAIVKLVSGPAQATPELR